MTHTKQKIKIMINTIKNYINNKYNRKNPEAKT